MKTNDYLLLTAGAAFSYLFYDQNAGINFLVFDLLFVGLMIVRSPYLLRDAKWWWMASLTLLSGTGILINSSTLALIANCICLLTLAAVSFNSRTSAIFSFILSVLSVLLAIVSIVDSCFKKPEPEQSKNKLGAKLLIAGIVITLSLLFLFLYRSANPLFAANTAWINLDFLSFGWLFFTLLGFLICYGLIYIKTSASLLRWDDGLAGIEFASRPRDEKRSALEKTVATWLFVLLNLMLVILNVGDLQTLYFGGQLPEGLSHSDFVHNGIGTSIFSILLATALILYVLRFSNATQSKHKILIALIVVWILQTLMMLINTSERNNLYIQDYGLTYKRVGVFVWLALAAVGLLILALKIIKAKSTLYLLRKNFAVWLSILALSSLFNWDVFIIRYNLAHHSILKVDYVYLLGLSDAVIPDLMNVRKDPRFPQINEQLLTSMEHINFNVVLTAKINQYVSHYNPHWQSWDLREQAITQSILRN